MGRQEFALNQAVKKKVDWRGESLGLNICYNGEEKKKKGTQDY